MRAARRRKTSLPPLWASQAEAIDAVEAGFTGHDRVQIVHACGSGKTRIALETVPRHIGWCLYIVPTRKLALQVKAAADAFGIERCIAAVSESNAGLTDKVFDLAFEAPGIIICTVTSAARVLTEAARRRVSIGLCISDEAHRLAGIAERAWSRASSTALPYHSTVEKWLFMTATQRYVEPGYADQAVISMDDENEFGPVVHAYSFEQAVLDGVILDVEVIVAPVEDKEGLTDSERFAQWRDALSKIHEERSIARFVTYHRTIREAENFAAFLKAGGYRAASVHSHMPAAVQESNVKVLRSPKLSILTQCKLFAEGVDTPDIDCVFFTTRKTRMIDVIQAVGRTVRPGPGKACGYAAIPVPSTGADEDPLKNETFRAVWALLNQAFSKTTALQVETAPMNLAGGRTKVPFSVFDPVSGLVTQSVWHDAAAYLEGTQFIRIVDKEWIERADALLARLRAGKPLGKQGNIFMKLARRMKRSETLPDARRPLYEALEAELAGRQRATEDARRSKLEVYIADIQSGRPLDCDLSAMAYLDKHPGDPLAAELFRQRRLRRLARLRTAYRFLVRFERGEVGLDEDRRGYKTLRGLGDDGSRWMERYQMAKSVEPAARRLAAQRKGCEGAVGRGAKTGTLITGDLARTLPPRDKEYLVWDTEITGFAVRVRPSGTKVYVLQARNGAGKLRRRSLGRTETLRIDEARRLARAAKWRIREEGAEPACPDRVSGNNLRHRVGRHLRHLRGARQEDPASLEAQLKAVLGLTLNDLFEIEAGVIETPLERLADLCAFYGVSLGRFMTEMEME